VNHIELLIGGGGTECIDGWVGEWAACFLAGWLAITTTATDIITTIYDKTNNTI
jgi:hypothetical protein